MMNKVKILLFAADPRSRSPARDPRLLLDEDIRQIREKIRLSEHRDAFEVDLRLAARLDDLLQALNEVQPDIVHFSGHGWSEGLVLMDREGRGAQGVDRALLTDLFRTFRGSIRVVVLNACDSHDHARAIADVVGCAIGMRGKISDPAAIAFGAAFYRALGFGHSVQGAFNQGRLAIGSSADRDCPQLAARRGVDPERIRLVSRPPKRSWAKRAIVSLVVIGAAVAAALYPPRTRPPDCAWDQDGMPLLTPVGSSARMATSTRGYTTGAGTELEVAKAQQRARNDTAAFPHFNAAAEAGVVEAMGYLGVAYLCGEGTARHPKLGIFWLRQAAGKRDARGMTALAFAYEHGVGVGRSRRWAVYWYRLAAETARLPEAMRRLGGLYEQHAEWDSAVAWYRRAINAGSLDAMVDLGSLYDTGPPSLRAPAHARALYDSAARAGSARGLLAVGRDSSSPAWTADPVVQSAPPPAAPDSFYRPPPVDETGNVVRNGGFHDGFAQWTRSGDLARGKGTNEIVPFADARSGRALHLTYEGRGSLEFTQKLPVSGPDYVFRGTFRASAHEGAMIGFSGTGIATIMLQYLDGDGRLLGVTSFYGYVPNPLANTPLVGVPRRGNGGNDEHYIDVEKDHLYKDFELDLRQEIEEHLLAVVPDQVRAVAITLYCGATYDGAGAELWATDLSLRPSR